MAAETYADLKERLHAALRALAGVAGKRDSSGVVEGARALAAKLDEERFNVVILGEFKRGKTTFVNALLGRELLPCAVVPLTSIVTAVRWGPEVGAEVTFAGGRAERVPVEELRRYVTERENPGNHLGVERALVTYPSEYLRDGVFLVDTPGVGSVYAHNTDAAHAFVPEADAAIFLTSADPPISAGERAFLEDVRAEAARMFFVLNKVDYLGEDDLAEALAFTEDVVAEALGRAVRVYPLSARGGLQGKLAGDPGAVAGSGLARFEEDFRSFLLREKGRTIVASVAGSARKLAADERNSLAVEERAVALSVEDLERTAGGMEGAFADAERSRDDLRALVRREARRILQMVEEDLDALRARETPSLLEEAGRFLEGSGPRPSPGEADAFVAEALRRRMDRWRGDEERRVGEAFAEGTARFVGEANRLVERTVRLCGEALGIELEQVAAPGGITAETEFSYRFFEVPTILESLLPDTGRLLPAGWSRRRARARLRERVPALVDRHCGRLRWDYQQRLDASRIALERLLGRRLDETVQSLRLGLDRAAADRRAGEERAAIAVERVRDAGERLRGVDAALLAILAAVEDDEGARPSSGRAVAGLAGGGDG